MVWDESKRLWTEAKNLVGYMEDLRQRRSGPWVELQKRRGKLTPQQLELRKTLFAFRDALRRRQQAGVDAVHYRNRTISFIREPLTSPESYQMFEKVVAMKHLHELGNTPIGRASEIKRLSNRFARADARLAAAGTKRAFSSALSRWVKARKALDDALSLKPLPEGLTSRELAGPLRELLAKATPDVLEAVRRFEQTTLENAIEGVKRGYLSPEVLGTGTYFPHAVLEYSNTHLTQMPFLSSRMKTPFRPFAQRLRGSNLRINMDFDEAFGNHLIRFHLANAMDDFTHEWMPQIDGFKSMPHADYKNLFTRDDGKLMRPHELEEGHRYEWRGETWVPYRITKGNEIFGPRVPKNPLDALFYNLTSVPIKQRTYFLPERVMKYLTIERMGRDAAVMEQAIQRYVTFWKGTQIIFGGFPTRIINTFGDMFQHYLEDLPGMHNMLRFPTILRTLLTSGEGRPDIQQLQRLISQYRVAEGATFFGPQAMRLEGRIPWRQMTKAEKLQRIYAVPGDLATGVNWLANAAEVWPRISMFMTKLKEYERTGKITSKFFDIEGLRKDPAAGHIGRNTMVDYEAVSKPYRTFIRSVALPFVTWFHRITTMSAMYLHRQYIEAPLEAIVHPTKETIYKGIKGPIEATAKVTGLIAAAWYWNNIRHRKEEENVNPWVKKFVFHLTMPWKSARDPEANTVLIFPTGMDLFMNLAHVPDFMERVAEWNKGERKNIMEFKGWSTMFQFLVDGVSRGGTQAIEMAPIAEALVDLNTGINRRTGQQIVPEGVADPAQVQQYQLWYLFKKAIPVLDRIATAFEKDMDKVGQDADLRNFWARLYQSVFKRGRFSGDPRTALDLSFNYPQDLDLGLANRLLRNEQQYDILSDQTLYDFEQALGASLAGNDKPLDAWFQAMRSELDQGRVPFNPESAKKRLFDPPGIFNAWQRIVKREQLEAPTPEAREHARDFRRQMKLAARWYKVMKGGARKTSKVQAILDEMRRMSGHPPSPPDYGIELPD